MKYAKFCVLVCGIVFMAFNPVYKFQEFRMLIDRLCLIKTQLYIQELARLLSQDVIAVVIRHFSTY
jgi:hypothetical protein